MGRGLGALGRRRTGRTQALISGSLPAFTERIDVPGVRLSPGISGLLKQSGDLNRSVRLEALIQRALKLSRRCRDGTLNAPILGGVKQIKIEPNRSRLSPLRARAAVEQSVPRASQVVTEAPSRGRLRRRIAQLAATAAQLDQQHDDQCQKHHTGQHNGRSCDEPE